MIFYRYFFDKTNKQISLVSALFIKILVTNKLYGGNRNDLLCIHAFSKLYHRHSELIVKYNIGLKTLLQQGISEPIFYGNLVYKFKRIVGKPNFSDQFKKIVKRYISVGYNSDIMRQSACLVLNPITVYSYGFLFNCTKVGQASDSMTSLT